MWIPMFIITFREKGMSRTLLFLHLSLVPAATCGFEAFVSGSPWLDTKGNLIDAHGGGMLHVSSVFSLYFKESPTGRSMAHQSLVRVTESISLFLLPLLSLPHWVYF